MSSATENDSQEIQVDISGIQKPTAGYVGIPSEYVDTFGTVGKETSPEQLQKEICDICVVNKIGIPVYLIPTSEQTVTTTTKREPAFSPDAEEIEHSNVKMHQSDGECIGRLLFSPAINKVVFVSSTGQPGFYCEFSITSSESHASKPLTAEPLYIKFLAEYLSGNLHLSGESAMVVPALVMSKLPGEVVVNMHLPTPDQSGKYETAFLELYTQLLKEQTYPSISAGLLSIIHHIAEKTVL